MKRLSQFDRRLFAAMPISKNNEEKKSNSNDSFNSKHKQSEEEEEEKKTGIILANFIEKEKAKLNLISKSSRHLDVVEKRSDIPIINASYSVARLTHSKSSPSLFSKSNWENRVSGGFESSSDKNKNSSDQVKNTISEIIKRRNNDKLLSDIDIKTDTCRQIISRLFFSDVRTVIFITKEIEKIQIINRELKSYYSTRLSMNVSIDFLDAFSYYWDSYFKLTWISEENGDRIVERTPALKLDEDFLQFATSVVILQWKISCLSPFGLENPSNLEFVSHTLAVMNHLKKEGRNQRLEESDRYVQIIPPSDFARKYWPPMKDIDLYGFTKAKITIGTSTLMKVWKSIHDDPKCEFPEKMLSRMYKKVKAV
jgi:hypothetical protein